MTSSTLNKLKKAELIEKLNDLNDDSKMTRLKLIWTGLICFWIGLVV